MVLNNHSPLYELIWYPQEGLRIKYASLKMVEEKADRFRNSESFDITIPSPRHSNNEQNIRTEAPARDELIPMTSKLDSEMTDFLNSHASAGFSMTNSHAQDLRSSRNTESRGKENEAVTMDKSIRIHSDREKAAICFSKSSQGVGTSNTMTGARAVEEERRKISNPGHKDADDLIVYSESRLLKGKMPENSPKYANQANDLGLSEVNCREHVADISKPNLETKDEDEKIIRTTKHISNFNFFRARCSSGANLERQQVHRAHSQHLEKGKEKVLHSEEDCGITSKEREDSNESVKSNSRKVVSKRKRAKNGELTATIDCKRLRREYGGSSSSEPLFRKDNTFMRWISSITGSYSRCDQSSKTLATVPQDSNGIGCFDSIPRLEEKSEGARCRTSGFASVFQAIYSPSIVDNSNHNTQIHERLEGANHCKELNISNPQVNDSRELNIGNPPVHEKINSVLMPHEVWNPAIGELCDGEVKGVHGTELGHDNTSTICGNITHAEGKTCLPRIMEPLSPSRKNILMCAEEDGNQGLTSAPNSSVNTDIEGNNCFAQSSWISRFLRKESPLISQPFVSRSDMDVVPQKLNNQNILEGRPYRGVSSFGKKPENLVNRFASQVESQRLINTYPEQQQYSISPIVSSEFNNTSISSLFAKRLDALRHLMPSKVAEDLSCAATTCFFCGKVGHSLRDCSSLAESDLKNLLEFMKSYKSNKLPPPFCIRCFQENHWAIACPSSRIELENNTDNPLTVSHADLNRADKNPINQNSPNFDGKINLWAEGNIKEHQQHNKLNFMAQRVDSRYEVGPVSTKKSCFREISSPIVNSCYQNLSKEYPSKGTAKFKQSVSRYWDNEAKGTKVRPLCEFVGPQVDGKQNGIFEAIRRLRLSRTEIMRLLKSDNSHIRLEGFYLRLRLGKWDEGLRGTGYHVALINGASHEDCVSVSIGHKKYSVNCRFVSNQDYSKDELEAWWLANSRGQGKIPSKEDLKKKLKERAELKL